jgi:hypothetical protein
MQNKALRAVAAFLVVLGLIFGQAAPGLAAVPMNMEQPSMMAQMDSHHYTSSVSNGEHKDASCCSHADINHTMKTGTCGDCYVAACQAVMLPSQFAAPVLYESMQTYGMMNTFAVGKSVLPEPPYPKA